MAIFNRATLIMPEQDRDLLRYSCASTNKFNLCCDVNDTVNGEFRLENDDVSSNDWCVVPQSSATDVKEIFGSWDAESKGSRKRVIACARDLCANVLGGEWREVKTENFRMKAIKGGMSNLLFLVELPEDLRTFSKTPRKALLRIFCGTDLERRLNESIIFTVLSERDLGPRLLGVFPGGRFEQFIPSRPLSTKEIGYPSVASRIGQMLARIHALDVPVAKWPTVIEVAEGYLQKLRKLNRRMVHKFKNNTVHVDLQMCPDEINCSVLSKELEIMKQCVERSNSPIVFSHNDLQELNILMHAKYTLDKEGNLNAENDETPFALIDFEYSSYNYRGFDLANHFCEHMIDYSNVRPPYYNISPQNLPTEKQQRLFINSYIDEIEKVKNEGCAAQTTPNSAAIADHKREMRVQELLVEVRRFFSVTHLFWAIWSFELAEESPIEFDYVSYGIDRLALYFSHKKDMLEYIQRNH